MTSQGLIRRNPDDRAGPTRVLIAKGVRAVGEGANTPSSLDATRAFLVAEVLFGPAKAANAGGVNNVQGPISASS